MKNKLKASTVIVTAALILEGWAIYVISLSPGRWRPALIVRDEPEAHALYDAMIEAVHSIRSLSYDSVCSGPEGRASSYKVRLNQFHTFRVEWVNGMNARSTTVVGNSKNLWVFWSGDRPYLKTDDYESHEATRSNAHIEETGSVGTKLIKDRIAALGCAWFKPIFDPSIFHGHVDPFESYIDGIRGCGTNRVGDELCDVIEVSYFRAQRTRFFWLSKEDRLPRRIKEVVRLAEPQVTVEEWSNVTIDPEIPANEFVWTAPETSQPFSPRKPDELLLSSGQEASDFELRSAEKGTICLSSYRGKVVWLYIWQVGSPLCRKRMLRLQSLYEKHLDQGVIVLGVNVSDDRRIARDFLQANPVKFPIVLDASKAAKKVVSDGYGNEHLDVPVNCIIDRCGRVVDSWHSHEEDWQRGLDVLARAGCPVESRSGR